MRIIHVGLDLVPSSGGSVVSIRDFGHVVDSTIISFTNPAKLKQEGSAIPDAIHIETSPGFWGRTFAWAPEDKRRAAREAIHGADLIVCHILLRYHVHWVKEIARQENIPYWVVPHGCLDPYVFSYRSLVKNVWFSFFGRQFLKSASRVIFATEKEKLKARRYYFGENCLVIHWPVQVIDVAMRERVRERILHKLKIAVDDKILICLGRLHPMKRPIETIEAFAYAQVSGTHLVLVGPDERISRQDCLDLAKKLGVKNLHVLGPVYGEEKNAFLLAADAYISLSHRENFGYTTAEALSAGLPVILSPGNDLADELKALKCGWMLRDNRRETAAAAICEFASMSMDKLQDMGQRGRYWALTNLDSKMFADQVRLAARETLKQAKNKK